MTEEKESKSGISSPDNLREEGIQMWEGHTEDYDIKCIRCGYEWKQEKNEEAPVRCPHCNYAYWDKDEGFKPPTWKHRGMKVTFEKRLK